MLKASSMCGISCLRCRWARPIRPSLNSFGRFSLCPRQNPSRNFCKKCRKLINTWRWWLMNMAGGRAPSRAKRFWEKKPAGVKKKTTAGEGGGEKFPVGEGGERGAGGTTKCKNRRRVAG